MEADFTFLMQFFGVDSDERGQIDLDTTLLSTEGGDGEWDIILRAENEHGFVDNFYPFWDGDGNELVNTDEKYMKRIGAWYDKDRKAETEPEKGGKVVVDNTPPTVSNFGPQ